MLVLYGAQGNSLRICYSKCRLPIRRMALLKSLGISSDAALQHIAACPLFLLFFLGPLFSFALSIYIVFFTSYYPLFFAYVLWIVADREVCFKDGRRLHWLRRLNIWAHYRNYFPQNLVITSHLPSEKNYMLCIFPHGVLCSTIFAHFLSETSEFYRKLPKLNVTCHTLNINFFVPFIREYTLGLGLTSVSRRSILHQLEKPGGQVSVVFVGGSKEALKSTIGEYRLVLKSRKGFVRLCMTTGTQLVPAFAFNEVDIYGQRIFSKDTLVRRFQELVRRATGVAPCVFFGRGFLNLAPHIVPVTTVIGKPIPVEKVENPTNEEVIELHEKFIRELTDLFETNKHKYLKNPNVQLFIED